MTNIYELKGMTCTGCKATVERNLSQVDKVTDVRVNLEKQEAEIDTTEPVPTEVLRRSLPHKYQLSQKKKPESQLISEATETTSKLLLAIS